MLYLIGQKQINRNIATIQILNYRQWTQYGHIATIQILNYLKTLNLSIEGYFKAMKTQYYETNCMFHQI